MDNIWSGFYKKTREQRLDTISNANILNEDLLQLLKNNDVLTYNTADNIVENVVGTFSLPFGIVPNFIVDNVEYTVPMVTEEPSVIAACSNAGKLVALSGGFKTTIHNRKMLGHVTLYDVPSVQSAYNNIMQEKETILNIANEAHPSIVRRGGGAENIKIEINEIDNVTFLSVFLIVDTLEAMGANIVNTMLEAIKPALENISHGKSLMAILTNLADESLVTATCEINVTNLVKNNSLEDGRQLAKKIELASKLAKVNCHRAATHNKGIFNGIDSIIVATGNDWRAIEAAGHSYAAMDGNYRGLTTWTFNEETNTLFGELTLPMPVASVGGSIGINPSVNIARGLLNNPDAKTLARICLAVGLAQNLAAVKALVSDGIQKGHMKLHAKSLALLAGATSDNVDIIVEKLLTKKHLNLKNAKEIISDLNSK